ncbi:phosphopantetheine-binding protein [Alkalimonas collagenimarina]|uniref:Phosphopantetheine-binding protein n=1 Tax=Alkalimonas collagenimarina TaxID=400390 RepID=A0ABT9GWX6_9GAMM|nr:phosphopantetheine-binding protein [Alkalimonas collagenimarina]MDP4535565.1 phosphopantetheine-binding protein [Alkalimonas collagenimarina]
MLDAQQIKNAILDSIIQEVATVLSEKSLPITDLQSATAFSELSLTSLDLAELISNLEARYEVDPFEELVAITSVVTFDDLAAAYTLSLSGQSKQPHDALSEELKAIKNQTR